MSKSIDIIHFVYTLAYISLIIFGFISSSSSVSHVTVENILNYITDAFTSLPIPYILYKRRIYGPYIANTNAPMINTTPNTKNIKIREFSVIS